MGFEPTDLLQSSVFKTGALNQAQPTLRCLVVDIGYDPIRSSPSDQSPGIIRPRRTPVLSTNGAQGRTRTYNILPLKQTRLPIASLGRKLLRGDLWNSNPP